MPDSDLDYAYTVGRLGIAVGDGPDDGENPDIIWCNEGTVRFTPLQTYTKVSGAVGGPATIGQGVIVAELDSEGYILYRGKRGVWLVDLTSEKVNPVIGPNKATHKIDFDGVKADGTTVDFQSVTVRLTRDGDGVSPDKVGDGGSVIKVNDITVLAPIAAGSATPIYRGERGTGIAAATVTPTGELELRLTDETVVNAGELPVGPGGSAEGVAGYLAESEVVKEAFDQTAAQLFDDPDSVFRVRQIASFAALTTVDLASFLLPGEDMPNDGVLDAQPLLQRAVDALALRAATEGPMALRVPIGRYRLLSSVRWFVGYHVGIIGAGRANTVFLPEGNAVLGLMDPSFPADGTATLDDLIFADYTVDCSAQTSALNNVGVKAIALRWMKGGLFYRVRAINSWATSFGCDFLRDVTFTECTAIGSGRGVEGQNSFGAGFGIGVGAFPQETVSFVRCYSEGHRSSGFFIERIHQIPSHADARGFALTACTAVGGYDGVRDTGGDGVIVNGCHFLNNSNAGLNIDGYTDGRHGGRNGLFAQNVIRGNGVGVRIRYAATGGYTLENNEITENIGAGVTAGTDARLGPGWRFMNNRVERNGAGGILLDAALLGRPQIVGNTVRENGVGDGIRIGGDTYEPRITGNTVQGHIGVGINLPDASRFATSPWIADNVVTENAGGAIVNAKATDTSEFIKDNRTSAPFTTITNHFITPNYEAGVSQIAPLGGTLYTRFAAPEQITGDGPTYARLMVNKAGPPAIVPANARVGRRTAAMSGAWTWSAEVRTDVGANIRPFAIAYWNDNAATRQWDHGGFRGTGDWQRVWITHVLPANGSRSDFGIGLDRVAIGDKLEVRRVMLTQGAVVWPYFDGDLAPAGIPDATVAWSGTPDGSPSVLTLPDNLDTKLLAAAGAAPLVSLRGADGVNIAGIPTDQPITVYSVIQTPTASMRAGLRSGATGGHDVVAVGRNGANTAWVALSTDSAGAVLNAQATGAASPAVAAGVRDGAGITLAVRGGTPVTTPIPGGFEAISATRVSHPAGTPHTLVYAGAHDAAKRVAVMDVLASQYGIA